MIITLICLCFTIQTVVIYLLFIREMRHITQIYVAQNRVIKDFSETQAALTEQNIKALARSMETTERAVAYIDTLSKYYEERERCGKNG